MFVDIHSGNRQCAADCISVHRWQVLSMTSAGAGFADDRGKSGQHGEEMDIPVLGLVENMSYLECRVCGRRFLCSVKAISRRRQTGMDSSACEDSDRSVDCVQDLDEGLVEYVESPWLDTRLTLMEEGIREYRYIEEVEEYRLNIAQNPSSLEPEPFLDQYASGVEILRHSGETARRFEAMMQYSCAIQGFKTKLEVLGDRLSMRNTEADRG